MKKSNELKKYRALLNITQLKTAYILDVGLSTVANWEQGSNVPDELKWDGIRQKLFGMKKENDLKIESLIESLQNKKEGL